MGVPHFYWEDKNLTLRPPISSVAPTRWKLPLVIPIADQCLIFEMVELLTYIK